MTRTCWPSPPGASGCIFVLPLFLGLDGIWLAVTAAEVLTLAVTVLFLLTQRRRYGYGG